MKSKILFVLHLPPPVHGASMVGQYIKDSSRIKDSFDADFINLSTSSSLDEIGRNGSKKLLTLFKIQFNILKALVSKKYDLCYVTLTAAGPGFYKDFLVVLILKLFNKKVLFHFHNKGIKQAGKTATNRRLYKFVFKHTQVILLANSLYDDIADFVPKTNVFFCANGIPDIEPVNEIVNKIPLQKPCKLLFLSNMMAEKGVYILLQACHVLKTKGVPYECNFVGNWSDVTPQDFDLKVKELELTGYVFAHGKKYNQEKISFFTDANIFVFPTYYHNECLPLVLLEAMQYSLPIVTTAEGAIADIVTDGETGLLTAKEDYNDLASKLEILISNRQMQLQMGQLGRLRYNELFTLEKFEENLVSIIKQASLKKSI